MSEAVQLLRAINASIQNLSKSFTTLKPGDMMRDPIEEARQRAEKKARRAALDVTLAHTKLMKSSLIEGAKELRSRRQLRDLAAKAAEQLEQAAKGAKSASQRMQILEKYIGEIGDALHGLTDDQLRDIAKAFDNSTGVLKGFGQVVEQGGHAVRDWIDRQKDAVVSSDLLIRTYRDLRRSNIDLIKDTKAQIALGEELKDTLVNMRRAGIEVDEKLEQMADQLSSGTLRSAKELDTVFLSVRDSARAHDAQLQSAMASIADTAHGAADGLRRAGRQSILTSDNILRAGAAVVGWNAFMSGRDDGSSLIGDLQSAINTNIQSGFFDTSLAAILTGQSAGQLRESMRDRTTGGGLTMGQVASLTETSPDFGVIAAAGGQEAMQRYYDIVGEQIRNLGGDLRQLHGVTRSFIYNADAISEAGIVTRDQYAAISQELSGSASVYELFARAGYSSVEAQQNATAKLIALGHAAGFSAEQTKRQAMEVAELRNVGKDQFRSSVRSLMKRAAITGTDPTEALRAIYGDLQGEDAVKAIQDFQRAAGQNAQQLMAGMGTSQRLGLQFALADSASPLLGGGLGDLLGEARMRENRVAAITEEQRRATADLIDEMTVHTNMYKPLNEELGLFQKAIYNTSAVLAGVGQNSLISSVLTFAGTLFAPTLANMVVGLLGRVLRPLSGVLGKIVPGRMGGWFSRMGRPPASASPVIPAARWTTSPGAAPAAGATSRWGRLKTAGRWGGRALGPASALASGYFAYDDALAEGDTEGRALSRGTGATVGAGLGLWGGMAAGAAIGSAFGGIGAIPGALIGLGLGALGAWGGSELGDIAGGAIYDAATDEELPSTDAARETRDTMIDVHRAIVQTGNDQLTELQRINEGIEVLIGVTSSKSFREEVGRRNIRSFRQTASAYGMSY